MTENALIVIEIRCKFLKLSAITISDSLQILFYYVFLKFTPPTLQTSLCKISQNETRLQTAERLRKASAEAKLAWTMPSRRQRCISI